YNSRFGTLRPNALFACMPGQNDSERFRSCPRTRATPPGTIRLGDCALAAECKPEVELAHVMRAIRQTGRTMRRRDFLTFLSGAAASSIQQPRTARAQPKIRRLGVLSQGSASTHPTAMFSAFQQGLRDLGWVEGHNLAIDWRFSEGTAEPLPRLAAELVGLPVELIVATPTRPALAAKNATSTIPVVFIQVADPVQSGIVTNLARPGTNVTGLSGMGSDLSGKRLELLKEALPSARLVAVLWHRPSQGSAVVFRELELASDQLGIELKPIAV